MTASIVALVFGVLLIAIVGALILSPSFRSDLIAGSGNVHVLGLFSVQGAIVVLLCALFSGGLLWAANEGNAPVSGTPGGVPDVNHGNQLTPHQASATPPSTDLVAQVRELDPRAELSESIRALARSRKGPWAPYGDAEEVQVSVLGEVSSIRGCPERHRDTVQLVSAYGDANDRPAPISRPVNGLIFAAADCSDLISYDFQISCRDGERLFGERVVSCTREGQPIWNVEPALLPAFASTTYDHLGASFD